MIIKALLDLVYTLVNALLVFELPQFPSTVTDVLSSLSGYMVAGISILRAFLGDTCMSMLAVLLGLVLAMNAAYLTYSLVFWVLRKIPMFSVKE